MSRVGLSAVILAASPLVAQIGPAPIEDDGLSCTQVNGGVSLAWNFAFFAPIEAYVLQRDGQHLAQLPPDATGYFDGGVTAGTHAYHLLAINWDGSLLDLARCEVSIDDFGLRCRVDGNQVHLGWGPIVIDVLITKFRISRDGETIATVPPDQLSYLDEVFTVGAHSYAVHAVTGPDSEFLVGRCTVRIVCFDLRTSVDDLKVSLGWDGSPVLTPLAPTYVITRDDQLVAKTQANEYTDEVPAPGTYLYQVHEDFGGRTAPIRLVGACLVRVSGSPVPGPQDLACTVELVPGPIDPVLLDPLPLGANDPTRIDLDGDGVVDSLLPRGVVSLKWTNPVDSYDKIVIVRNGVVIATLDGSAESFRDHVRAGGTYHYAVHAIVGDQRTDAAECTVDVPPAIVPPPQDLTCSVLQAILFEPADPTQPIAAAGADVLPSPITVVVLRWWNPIRYAKLVVARDGAVLETLPGDAMGFRDVNPPAGVHVYSVHGTLDDGRSSPAVRCTVEIGTRPVPPVTDLLCSVDQPTAANASASVILVWDNPITYDTILVLRDGEVIFEDGGELRKYRDLPAPAGVHTYCVIGILGNRRSPATCCQVVIEGPPRRNLLYFSPGLLEPAPVDLGVAPPIPDPLPPLPGNRIVCLADHPEPLQGWSFGVGNDPKLIVPSDASIEGTATQALHGGAGPDFLHLEIQSDGSGVVMAVVVDSSGSTDPSRTLPPGRGHRLLRLEYAEGPEAVPGEAYPVRYTSSLGSPPVQVLFVVAGFEVAPGTLPGWVSFKGPEFLRGDSNGDGALDISDAKHILDYLFLGGRDPGCLEAANANGTTQINIADPIYVLQFLFGGGPAPPFPFPACALAPAPLGCRHPGVCLSPGPLGQ